MDYGPEIDTYSDKTVGVYGGKFFPFHKGHLSYIMKAQSMVDVLFVVVQYDEEHEKKLIEHNNFNYVSPKERVRWVTETLKDFPNIRVFGQYEHRSEEHMTDPLIEETYKDLLQIVGGKIDVIFSNTWEYDEYFKKYLPKSEHVVFYENRDVFDISATQIREQGVFATWEYLPPVVQNYYKKRVAICGIESAGKTHISKMLAATFSTITQPEYGRTFYDEINGYTGIDRPEDYIDIVVGHCYLLNENTKKAGKVLIVDTEMIYTQFFHLQSNGYHHPVLDEMIKNRADKIDTYIYIEPFNEHELDGTRLHVTDEERHRNNKILKDLYNHYGIELIIVSEPNRDIRFNKCAHIIKELIL
jgi:HTH-type transcriptional repressor of NAD biosynthesis genes